METYSKIYPNSYTYTPDGVMAEQCPRKTKKGDIAMFRKYVKYSGRELVKTAFTLTYINKDFPYYRFGECELKGGFRNAMECFYFLNNRAITPYEDIKTVLREAGFTK